MLVHLFIRDTLHVVVRALFPAWAVQSERRDMHCDMSRASPPVYFVQVDHWEVQERAHVLCGRALPGPAIPNDPDSVHALCIADKRRHSHHIVSTAELETRFFLGGVDGGVVWLFTTVLVMWLGSNLLKR